MKRYLRHPLFAFSAVLLGILIHLSSSKTARASFPHENPISPLAQMADSMHSVTEKLDRRLAVLATAAEALPLPGDSYLASRDIRTIADRIASVRNEMSFSLGKINPDAFELAERINQQRRYLREMSSMLGHNREIVDALPTLLPSIGELTSPFGYRVHPISGVRKLHAGVDIAAVTGTPIFAAGNGTVVFSGKKGGYGSVVEIDHGYGYITLYGHASKLLVKTGDKVVRGQKVALVGSTGASTGPHLHFEVMVDSVKVDPAPFLALQAQRNDAGAVIAAADHDGHDHGM